MGQKYEMWSRCTHTLSSATYESVQKCIRTYDRSPALQYYSNPKDDEQPLCSNVAQGDN